MMIQELRKKHKAHDEILDKSTKPHGVIRGVVRTADTLVKMTYVLCNNSLDREDGRSLTINL